MPTEHAIQLKVSLRHVKPAVWRRIVIPEGYSFWDLHVAIQNAMGWLDTHLHEFIVTNPLTGRKIHIGYPDEESERQVLSGTDVPVTLFLNLLCRKVTYTYDFGDGWEHAILLEQISPSTSDLALPACIAGRRRCPPEDCGGPLGYADLLEALSNPKHPEHKELLEWLGAPFDPEQFDPKLVAFEDPDERLEEASADD
jgi:Plasmid pRiA4b ORF-3-like protein